jgi:hypothetical protein
LSAAQGLGTLGSLAGRPLLTKKDLQQALPRFSQFVRRFAPLLEDDTRGAPAEAYLRGLLLDADDHKNAETIALNADFRVP